MRTWLERRLKDKCTPVLARESLFSSAIGKEGSITFELTEKNSYSLYRYSVD